ncbi:MAG: CoA transferase [Alphaproteobacteria bacterium]|nr:CoA transferase [Alphaproteobacteria bacterium]
MNNETPLAGIRVVELGSSVAVPYGTWILATLGATVVKIERPEVGDDCREWGTGWYHGVSGIFVALNAGKHSVTVDLYDEEQRASLRRFIVEQADVVVQNLRPGQVEKMGLGADELLAEKETLIYVNSGAFGAKGPLNMRPGYDPLMQAFGGIMSVTGEEGRPPVRVGTSIVDMGTGMWCAMGVLAALQNRNRTGKGGKIDASLYETALGWMNYHATSYFGDGTIAERRGTSGPGMAPYQAYNCSDGYLIIAAPNDRLFATLCGILGKPEWPTDARFDINKSRWANRDTLNTLIEEITRTEPMASWQAKLEEAGIPNAPLQTIDAVVSHPQTDALGIIQETEDGKYKLMGMPLSFDGKRPPQSKGSPELGADNDIIFGDGSS